jgi:hypothetical protein
LVKTLDDLSTMSVTQDPDFDSKPDSAVIHDEDVAAEKGLPTEGKHSVGNALLVTADGEVRKLPVPSNDPNDPLNFTKLEKLGISVACCWFCKFSLISNLKFC